MVENPIRVLVVDGDRGFSALLQERIGEEADLLFVGAVHDGRSALVEIVRLNPDIVILDLVLPHLDGLGVLERAKAAGLTSKFVILTAFGSESFVDTASRLGADCFLLKPCDLSVLMQRVRETARDYLSGAGRHVGQDAESIAMEGLIAQRMTEIGIPAHYKGYRYLKDAIAMVIKDVSLIGQVTKVLYPTIAENHDSSPARVERAMRHAIETAWSRGDIDVLYKAFGYSVDANRGRPTNSSFIAKIADEIRLEMRAKREGVSS
ncbi:MAG: sporulation transcription factor Spo0A [Firmicutes bacterium]|nr:sporulation transcription factor Spo0A [Bacillota bacterium]